MGILNRPTKPGLVGGDHELLWEEAPREEGMSWGALVAGPGPGAQVQPSPAQIGQLRRGQVGGPRYICSQVGTRYQKGGWESCFFVSIRDVTKLDIHREGCMEKDGRAY